MEDVIRKRLNESLGKDIKIILKSTGWKYKGKLLNIDDKYIEMLDFVSNSYKVVEINNILECEVEL